MTNIKDLIQEISSDLIRDIITHEDLVLKVRDSLNIHLMSQGEPFFKKNLVNVDDFDFVERLKAVNGTKFNADQAIQTNKPIYFPTVINGKPGIRFEKFGVDDFLKTTNTINLSDPFTLFIVAAARDIDASSKFLISAVTSNNRIYLFYDTMSGSNFNYSFGDTNNVFTTPFNINPNIHVLTSEGGISNVEVEAFFNGNSLGKSTVNFLSASAPIFLGSLTPTGAFADADLGEVIMYDRRLSSSEIQQVLQPYLSPKWAISVATLTNPVLLNIKLHLLAFQTGYTVEDLFDLSSGFATSWDGISGTGESATQDMQTDKPLYVENGINGLPSLRLGGSNDWMDLNDSVISNDDFTIFVVAQYNSNDFSYLIGTDTSNRLYLFNVGGVFQGIIGDPAVAIGTVPSDTQPHIFTLQKSGNSFSLKVDDNEEQSGTTPATGSVVGLNIGSFNEGASGFLDGDIGEMIMYDRALSTVEKDQVIKDYLSPKWKIPLT